MTVRKLITRRQLVTTGGALLAMPLVGLLSEPMAAGEPRWRRHWRRSAGDAYPTYGSSYDRPLPVGQVTDSFWETQQTNAEAADFIFHDHEFVHRTALLTPSAKRHLEQVALRIEHVPFPIVIERSGHDRQRGLDLARREVIASSLSRMGVPHVSRRIVIAESFAEGISALEAEQAYLRSLGTGGNNRYGDNGRSFR